MACFYVCKFINLGFENKGQNTFSVGMKAITLKQMKRGKVKSS
jgi:hypothetical protein